MARKSKTKRSTTNTTPTALTEPDTGAVPTNHAEASPFANGSVEDFEIWLSTIMGGADWESHVDAFSDETC